MELNIECAIISLCHLFAEPNISSPLNTQAAQLWSNQEGGVSIIFLSSLNLCFYVMKVGSLHISMFVCRIPENGGEIVQASNSSLALFF